MPRTKNASAAIATVARQIEKLKKANIQSKSSNNDDDNNSVKNSSDEKNTVKKNSSSKKNTIKNSSDENEAEKRPKTAYQIFFTKLLAEIRSNHEKNGTQCPEYKELRATIIDIWNRDHKSAKNNSKNLNKNNEDKNKKNIDSETKRKPSDYNMFIKEIMPLLKKEHENDEKKLAQKDYMKLAAEKWREHKATKNIN
jgi:hypothetical protein